MPTQGKAKSKLNFFEAKYPFLFFCFTLIDLYASVQLKKNMPILSLLSQTLVKVRVEGLRSIKSFGPYVLL